MLPRVITGFQNLTGGSSAEAGEAMKGGAMKLGALALILFLVWLAFLFAMNYGAARLSYCQNVYTGQPESIAFMWSVVAFFFSGLYYPYQGLFLNPVCGLPRYRNNRMNITMNRAL